MSGKGVAAAVLLALMGGAWWWTWTQPGFRPSPPAASALPRAATSAGAAPEVALHRLHPRPVETPAAQARDPFASNAGAAAAAPRRGGPGHGSTAPSAAQAAADASPVRPRLELIGIAAGAAAAAATATRVAVLAGERGVVHATAGDVVWEVYRIDAVHDAAVDVTVLPERRVLTLRLR